MLRKLILGLLVGSIGVAQAAVSPYISASGGVALIPHLKENINGVVTGSYDMDPGACGEVATGVAIAPVRLEIAVMHQVNTYDTFTAKGTSKELAATGRLTMTSEMLNGYLDLATADWFTKGAFIPYLLAGVGHASVDDDYASEDAVAYQFGIGAGYLISDNAVIDLRYKYFATDYKSDADGILYKYQEIESHIIQIGLRYQF